MPVYSSEPAGTQASTLPNPVSDYRYDGTYYYPRTRLHVFGLLVLFRLVAFLGFQFLVLGLGLFLLGFEFQLWFFLRRLVLRIPRRIWFFLFEQFLKREAAE